MKRFNIFATMALAMVLGLGAAIGIGSSTKEVRSAEADNSYASGETNIYFSNNKNWSAVSIYSTGGSSSTSWPGDSMTYLGNNQYGQGIYWYHYSSAPNMIIFNGNGEQTKDIKSDITDLKGFYLTGSNYYGVETYNVSKLTVTFNANGGTGTMPQQVILKDGSKSLVDQKLNANAYSYSNRAFRGWNTLADGSGTSYTDLYQFNAGASITMSSLTLYAQWDSYQISVAGGSLIDMEYHDEDEVKATITASAGDRISFKKNGNDYPFTPKSDTNNNYNAAGFLFGGTITVYLNIQNAIVWASGISTTDGYYLLVNGKIIATMDSSLGGDYEVGLTGQHFSKEDAINVFQIINGDTYYYKNPTLDGGSKAGCFTYTDGTIKCQVEDYYDLYYKYNEGMGGQLYFGESASSLCADFAIAFNSAIKTICEGITGGTKSLADLKTAWGSQYSAYASMVASNKYTADIMKEKSSTATDVIGLCVAKYDYIVAKYGSALDGATYSANFMGRAIPSSGRIALFKTIMDPKTTGTAAIVVISSLVAIGAFAGYFFYKKKKEDR